MEISIKYPRKKFIDANNVQELQKQLNILMVAEFDIKNKAVKPFTDIKNNIATSNVSKNDFEILLEKNSVIIPTIITQCEA